MSGALPEAVLLDTCALIWLANGSPLPQAVVTAIVHAGRGKGVFVSPISAWEIGRLSRARERRGTGLVFLPDVRTWFTRAMAGPGIRTAALTPNVAIGASDLPGDFHGDPADRLLVATARSINVPLVTRDRKVLTYGEAGHVRTLAC